MQPPGARRRLRKTPTGEGPLRLPSEHQQLGLALGLGLLAPSYVAPLCPSRPDLISLDLELSKPFPAVD